MTSSRSGDDPSEPRGPSLKTAVLQREGRPVLAVQGMRLQVLTGPRAGTTFPATGDRLVLGTHARADVVLDDEAVSRFHCELVVERGRVAIRDLGSRNGTVVDGVSVLHAHLRPGAEITVGRTRLRFSLAEDPVDIPLSEGSGYGTLVGASPAMRRVFEVLARAATSDVTVLLEGETGTGKDAAAESLHLGSPRSDGPFVVVDCGAVAANLLESELFGHERGAFTGAIGQREGAFEAANKGTLFLDEIGELPLDLQPKLLRALEAREVKRVGASRHHPVDVRVVAATNRDLQVEVNARRFRSDLYYRLAVVQVRLPPLRERLEDLPQLVTDLLRRLGSPVSDASLGFLTSPEFLRELDGHRWPGNVRELRNHLERCVALREPTPLGTGAAPAVGEDDLDAPLKVAREACVARFERRYLEHLLEAYGGNASAAARAAGIDRVHLYRLLWRHGLK